MSSAEPKHNDKVVDLMAALSRRLEGHASIPRAKAERFAATSRRGGPERRRKRRRASSQAA